MKKKNTSKKVLAILLSFIMIATSVPLGIMSVAAGAYDPAPKFSEEAQTYGARAWLDDEGNVQVTYPEATAEPTYKGEELAIAFYILELVDMGAKNEAHQNKVIKTIKATGTSATFKAADIGVIDLESNRYSVTITAVDTENWFSQPIYTTVTNVPIAKLDEALYEVESLSDSDTAVREIMTFEQSDKDTSETKGNALLYMGVAAEAGTEDLSDNVGDTSALRFIMNEQPTGTQSFDTSLSRQTWNFSGAKEIWFWMDLSDVEITGLSFRLRAQEKSIKGWGDGKIDNVETLGDNMGSIVYSTKGTAASTYKGEDPYVYVQREDGLWDKVALKDDGTIDLGNFKGYIRVPLDFMCSETDAVITARNDAFDVQTNQKNNLLAFIDSSDPSDEQIATATAQSIANINNFFQVPAKVVDAAGTPVSDALLLQRRVYQVDNSYWYARKILGFISSETAAGDTINLDFGLTPAVELNISKGGYTTNGEYRATVTENNDGTVTIGNREKAHKAIDDIYSAGFAFEGASKESCQNSFFVDNIFFYRDDNLGYSGDVLIGDSSNGNNITDYYNEELTISKIIFDEIDNYITDPDWADYRELEYILEMIEEYKSLYTYQQKNTAFLDLTRNDLLNGVYAATGLGHMADVLNREETWEKAWLAYEACAAEGTIDATKEDIPDWFIANAGKDELVPNIVNTMEKLPAPETITAVSEALRKEIVKLWQAYSLLNLGQLEMLGQKEEERVLKYIALLDNIDDAGDEFVVGQQLADYPFIVFNDFEAKDENNEDLYPLGYKGYQLEDNKDAYSIGFTSVDGKAAGTHNPGGSVKTMKDSWRHLKNLVTYTTNGSENITTRGQYGYSPDDSDYDEEVMDNKLHYNAASATITDNGYLNSKAATIYVDSSFTVSSTDNPHQGVYHSVTVTRHGKNANSWEEMQANNTSLDGLQELGKDNWVSGSSSYVSLIFYVDFTEISNFNFSINIFTKRKGTLAKAGIEMGTSTTSEENRAKNWNYWILDEATGEWVENNTNSPYSFTSAKLSQDPYNNEKGLDNYQGYIKIPLYHFKFLVDGISDIGGSTNMLDYDDNEALGNIFAIQFAVAGNTPESLDEKSFTIDNIGFTYEPGSYNVTTKHKSYAEIFGAKSLPAKNFEDVVDAIDPYEKSTLETEVVNALAMYNQLSAHQQSMVQEEKDTLDLYLQYVAGTNSLPKPTYTPAQLEEFVNTLPEEIRKSSVTGTYIDENGEEKSYDIPYPGFKDGAVDYESKGITLELANEIVKYYQEGYARYSKTQKSSISNVTEFMNAYRMAMRMTQTLESIKDDAIGNKDKEIPGFLSTLTDLYTVKYDYDDDGILDDKDGTVENGDSYKVGNFISIAGREGVQAYKVENYDPLQYYSKISIDEGIINSQLKNTSRGFTYFLNNTRTFDLDGDGNIDVQGGILQFRDKMQGIYEMANTRIKEKTLFSEAELQSIKDILEEYNALLPAYYNVEELYELEQAILRLFPAVSPPDEITVDEILLTEEKLTGDTSTYKVTYSEVLDLNNKGDKYYVRVTSANGAMVNDYGNTVDYDIAIGSTNVKSKDIDADSPYTIDVANNTYTPDSPLNITITPSLSSKPTGLSGAVYDEITVELVYYETVTTNENGTTTDTVVETVVDGSEQTIYVSYTMGDAYTVTIPAEFPVEWDSTDAVDVSYKVTTEMVATSKLTVGVTSDGTGKLTSISDSSLKLDYTTENFKTTEFGNRVTNAVPTDIPKVTVSGWDAVPVGEYRTTLTYTVVYEKADDGTT